MSPLPRTFRLLAAAVVASLAACGGDGDGKGKGAEPAAEDRGDVLLQLSNGVEVTRAEIEDWELYLDELDHTMGVKYRRRELLQQFLLPLKCAEHEFGEERKGQLEAAEALRAVAGNHRELTKRTALRDVFNPDQPVGRNELPLSVARWLFREENVLGASPVIPTPRGFVVAATDWVERGRTRPADRAKAYVVGFFTHDREAFNAWWSEYYPRLKVEWVHSELSNALPVWLNS